MEFENINVRVKGKRLSRIPVYQHRNKKVLVNNFKEKCLNETKIVEHLKKETNSVKTVSVGDTSNLAMLTPKRLKLGEDETLEVNLSFGTNGGGYLDTGQLRGALEGCEVEVIIEAPTDFGGPETDMESPINQPCETITKKSSTPKVPPEAATQQEKNPSDSFARVSVVPSGTDSVPPPPSQRFERDFSASVVVPPTLNGAVPYVRDALPNEPCVVLDISTSERVGGTQVPSDVVRCQNMQLDGVCMDLGDDGTKVMDSHSSINMATTDHPQQPPAEAGSKDVEDTSSTSTPLQQSAVPPAPPPRPPSPPPLAAPAAIDPEAGCANGGGGGSPPPEFAREQCYVDRERQHDAQQQQHLVWRFHNGRLVFHTVADGKSESEVAAEVSEDNSELNSLDSGTLILTSKDINKRVDENRSRLKLIEEKLKQAGITDTYDDNHNKLTKENLKLQDEVFRNSFCQFDATQIHHQVDATFDKQYVEVYDEFDSSSSTEEYYMMRDQNTNMTTNHPKHNLDKDNLKSLLKKPGKSKHKKNRVVFNETNNEFFDADYIILIREECDFDEDDDDSVCTCNQHEMVRLQCCEPNCTCYEQNPQSPKFAPPMEFVDAVTLSPPEGYKDMELGEQQLLALQQMARRGQRAPVCRECRECSHDDEDDDDGEGSQSDTDVGVYRTAASVKETASPTCEDQEEKEKTDQSQQTTPTTPPNDPQDTQQRNYILETISMTTTTEQRMLREVQQQEEETRRKTPSPLPNPGSPISGILKGGRLWKQQSLDMQNAEVKEQIPDSDDEAGNKRSVRFIESNEDKRDSCDGASDNTQDIDEVDNKVNPSKEELKPADVDTSVSPESTEMTLTFKLGNHVLISNNSLKPNSAVRQLFPCTKPAVKPPAEEENVHQYLVTAESLRAFEEAKRSKLPQLIQSGETDDSIKRAIERNTLRRSLIRYEPKNRRKTDNSLVERIKQLTCDVDEDTTVRVSPPGEESRNSPEVNNLIKANSDVKSFSPSSSSTTSSNSSSVSSTYKKITDLFGKRQERVPDVQNNFGGGLPDLGGPNQEFNSSNDSRRFLAPLTACVSAINNPEEYYYQVGERSSMASSLGTEYSLEDIDEGLNDGNKGNAPDVLAGTPSASESGDELALFVQQDASRIERIKKKYQPEEKKVDDEDDEHDDYGFNRRPSVRGIKPRFGSTTEILQQIQNQLQPPLPTRVNWPYYSESGLDNKRNTNLGAAYRPTSLPDENLYQNRCVYRGNVNSTVRSGCNEYYQSLPRSRSNSGGRPQSPPPLEVSKYQQTMVYIPYNHLEGLQPPNPYYPQQTDYARVSNQNQINKRYIEPIYQQRIHPQALPPDYNPNMAHQQVMKGVVRMPYVNGQPVPHNMMGSRSESPLPGQFSTARATQTPQASVATCNYYPANPRYRPMVGPAYPSEAVYVSKINRHSFPSAAGPRYPPRRQRLPNRIGQRAQRPDAAPHAPQRLPQPEQQGHLPHQVALHREGRARRGGQHLPPGLHRPERQHHDVPHFPPSAPRRPVLRHECLRYCRLLLNF
ncbi:unnamed protein product [Brassicogethes aeneus]|uniref:Uncharacterized protein n=1 Tax=Brassicogethes aeneus TaxID=1431903 RepID=A0A9P0B9A6_BRAAE|nr:unnamed protein product [Brassicogethes aeneus]